MKLNVFSSIIILLAVTCLSAQSDSLLVVGDSLLSQQAREDSLKIEAILDSLENQKPDIDYTAYLNLLEKVEEYKTERRKIFTGDSNKELYWSVQGHLFGLSSDNYFIKKDNFSELPSLYPTYLKIQNFNRLYSESITGDFYNLSKDYYHLPVTAIEVVAGTGDYDLGAGFVALKKNKFLDKYNLDFRMNFVKGDLYDGSELASNSSANLIIPFANSKLDIAFNSISYEGPYYRLSPAFQLNQTIFEESSQALSLYFTNNYLDLGLKYSSGTIKRITPSSLNREYIQLLLAKDLSIEKWHGQISYEYFLHNEDFYSQEFNSLSSDIDQLMDFQLSSHYERLNLSNRLIVTYPYQLLSDTDIFYNLSPNWKVGAFTDNRYTLKKENLYTDYRYSSDPNDNESIAQAPFYLNEKNNTGINLNYSQANLDITCEVGNATIDSELIDSSTKEEYQALKTKISANFSHTYGKYEFHLASLMKFYQEFDNKDIYYTPQANLTNSVEIIRDMDHDNYITAGIAYHFFDAFLGLEDKNNVIYNETSLLDLNLGFQITKQFEINAYWKNILDNQFIAGNRTIPQSITVLISWDFLN